MSMNELMAYSRIQLSPDISLNVHSTLSEPPIFPIPRQDIITFQRVIPIHSRVSQLPPCCLYSSTQAEVCGTSALWIEVVWRLVEYLVHHVWVLGESSKPHLMPTWHTRHNTVDTQNFVTVQLMFKSSRFSMEVTTPIRHMVVKYFRWWWCGCTLNIRGITSSRTQLFLNVQH